jgi:hypothetical protein
MASKGGQAWGTDLIVALTVFVVALTVFYAYANASDSGSESAATLKNEAEIISGSILSEGEPSNWTITNVVKIGILTDNVINQTKLEYFYSMANSSYSRTKNILNTHYDYYFGLSQNMTVYSMNITGIGKQGTKIENISAKILVKSKHVAVYNGKIVEVYVYLWKE